MKIGWKGLPNTITLANSVHLKVAKKMKCCEYISSVSIHNPTFSLQLMIRPNMLEFYMTWGWKGSPITNTLACLVHSKVVKKMKHCESISWVVFIAHHFMCNLWIAGIFHEYRLERLANYHHTSLFGPFDSNKEDKMLWIHLLEKYSQPFIFSATYK